ncbi:Zinc metalloproteinase nas-39, partial [Toxocara canis]
MYMFVLVCGGELKAEDTIGFIYSHARYSDDKYDKKMTCEWRIIAEAGRGVELRFAQFDLEKEANCEFDYVEVFDGLDRSDEHKMGHFCGDEVISVIKRVYNVYEISFYSCTSKASTGIIVGFLIIYMSSSYPSISTLHFANIALFSSSISFRLRLNDTG